MKIMDSKLLSLITFALMASILIAAEALPAAQLQDTKAPEFVGQIGSKSFYKYDSQHVNWFGARDLCKYYGLEIAEFANGEEWSYLRTTFRSVQHWIGARIPAVEQSEAPYASFAWTKDNGALSKDLPLIYSSEHFLCVYADGSDHFFTDFCLAGQHYALCQSISVQ